jgi:ribosome biogenesis GTPase A
MARGLGKAKKGRGKSEHTHKHKKSFPVIVENLIKEVDIVLEILDARFIEKSRHYDLEKKIKNSGKVLMHVLNKADLVDTNEIVKNEEFNSFKIYLFFSVKKRRGVRTLKDLIKMQAKKLGKEVTNVGVVGYPNTGKSSIINLLTGRSSAKTSPEAGYTKGIQKIKLSTNLYLIDTPGVIPMSEKYSTKLDHSEKHSQIGAITWDKTKNPGMVVHYLMKDNPNLLEKYYGIKIKDGDSENLIESLGQKLNYKLKGNEVDEKRTAKKILKDWQEGKIKI